MSKNTQDIFNDCVSFLEKQGLDLPILYCKVAKTKCAVGYLYSKLFGDSQLDTKDSVEVILELAKHYVNIPIQFFWDLTLMHDNAIRYQIDLKDTAKMFADKWKLDYTVIVNSEDDKEFEPLADFPLAA